MSLHRLKHADLPIIRNSTQPMKVWMTAFVLCTSLLAGYSGNVYSNRDGAFKELENLQQLAEESNRTGLPILLMFGAEWCEFCEQLVEEVFNPMAMRGNYDGKVVLMRHVGVDEQALIPGLDGEPIKKSRWAYQLDADLTPTVIFIDSRGREVAPRIVGISNIHMYAGVIHRNLNIAYEKMGNPLRIPSMPELYEKQLRQKSLNP
ncbi:thioredoxin family protein [Thiomicrorhabdus sp. ZW0627]|uniref:thioredoxin family protein n=1 Tax=Thiomicrorhabdus sp. ZW0627 TaxID=3039774 RepID=UPI002436564D|nr:thioredoxin fold domain-containing protein [Thiomicrorhabdus sp. ZW0627]MDG6774590.1 thioredoxin family protein [Thiomicrorhabdus sp. ZW0627]